MRKPYTEETKTEPTLNEVPMLTVDGTEIKVNTVLYRPSWDSGYGFKAKSNGKIEALRVFHVNNAARVFRVRCSRGCESVFKVADGCKIVELYGKLKNAKDYIWNAASDDLAKCNKKTKDIKKTWSSIVRTRSKLLRINKVKLPKAVRVSA